jgi:hypothetical protein
MAEHKEAVDAVMGHVQDVLQTCVHATPGKSVDEKKSWCVRLLMQLLNQIEGFIPAIRTIVNNPIIDNIEENAIKHLVDWSFQNIMEDKNESKKE